MNQWRLEVIDMKIKERLAKSDLTTRLLYYSPDAILRNRKKIRIVIETTNVCNLKCPLCSTNNGMTRKKGMMKFEQFKTIIDDIKGIEKFISLYYMGEPFLNPDIMKMIKYASDNKIKMNLSSNMTIPIDAEELVKSGLTYLVMSIDGVTKEVYEKYRVNGNLNTILNNVRDVVNAKKRLNSLYPVLRWQFVVMKHNKCELDKARALAEEMGADIFDEIGVDMVTSYGMVGKGDTGIYADSEFKKKENKTKICSWLWGSIILWNGDVTLCCFDCDGKYVVGNVSTSQSPQLRTPYLVGLPS